MYYKELSLPFNPWKDLPDHFFNKEEHQTNIVVNKYIKKEDFNKETVDWFLNLGLHLHHSMIFSYLPQSKGAIHIDGFQNSPSSKRYSSINFSIGGDGKLEWFKAKNSEAISPPSFSSVGRSPFNQITEENSILLESYVIKNPVLIDVETFHRGTNISDTHRYSLTLRWLPKMTFQQSLDFFRPYFLD